MDSKPIPNVKRWNTSQGPILASLHDLRKAAAINELLTEPAPLLPVKDTDPVLPFEIGLFASFSARLEPGIAKIHLRRAISAYASTKSYLLALAQPDAMRHDIEGHPVNQVSPEDRMAAQIRVAEIRLQRKSQNASAGGPGGEQSESRSGENN
jgi:ProP effector